MRTLQPEKSQKDEIEQDLLKLERGIRELKVAYDRFFNGALPREPLQQKFALKKIIKRYNEHPMQSYGQRFRFNSLVSRFNVKQVSSVERARNIAKKTCPACPQVVEIVRRQADQIKELEAKIAALEAQLATSAKQASS